MGQRFYQGRTNNHLTWVMVDSTDFATPESAMSAATKIKVYGKLQGATGVNFVSSGTGSLTNDIQHVGASVLGLYTIALAKADLSDASAAWYDQYVVSLSATGAAYQALVIEGVLTGANLSGLSALVSDVQSAITIVQSMASDAASAATQANSRVLLNQSRISDAYSMLSDFYSDFQSRVPKRVATDSQLSDLTSDLKSYLAVMSAVQSDLYSLASDFQSDFQSRVPKRVATDSQLSDLASDIKSAVAGITATVSASDISDIGSQVWANAVGAAVSSRVLLGKSSFSDLYSLLSDLQSDFQSRVPKRVATDSQLSDLSSDVKSAIAGIAATISASDISDIGSQVWANATGAAVSSRVLLAKSSLSDIYSMLSDLQSDFQSRVTKAVATNSQLSDLASDIVSDLKSFVTAGVDVVKIAGDTNAATDLKRGVLGNVIGTVDTGASTTSIPTSSLVPAAAVADQFKGRIVTFDRGTTTANLRGQATDITANTSGGTLTVTALTDAPASGDTFTIT